MRRRVRVISGVAAAVAVVAAALVQSAGWGAGAVPGSSGTDTSLPATDSKVVVQGRDQFADLKVTINQTRNLADQAVSVTWTGAKPTARKAETFGENFLQIFQCWGEDDGTNAQNPGPPPEQCVQGATDGVYGGRNAALFAGFTLSRIISRRGFPDYDPSQGSLDQKTGNLTKPFRAVDGTVVNQMVDTSFNPSVVGGNYWLNPYFNVITTNEIAGARTSTDGSGAELLETTTGLESTGLGCGQKVQKLADGTTKVPQCWIVVVPRGAAVDENTGTNFPSNYSVATSPLRAQAWKNRIAVPIDFNPVDSPCPLGADQRRIVGSELLSAAISSWQPALCSTPGLPPYAYGSISDSRARQQLLSGVPGAPGMAVVSRPIDPAAVDPQNPVVYAPLTLSGTVIGFNIERNPVDPTTPEGALSGVRVAKLNLTPRLVAKLLTQSYRSQVEINSKPPYDWDSKNPYQMAADPDFLRFNPEFELLRFAGGKNMGGLVLAGPNADAATQVWEWILADPEAVEWLKGTPDAWGMAVNPVYATAASANSTGVAFGSPLPDSYPKADPYCYQGPNIGPGDGVKRPPLCGLDWLPYVQGVRDAAKLTRVANDMAKTTVNAFAESPDKVYVADGPQVLGSRGILSMTDTASAQQYGVQTAQLSRAGDDGDGRSFVGADNASLLAGAAAMAPGAVPGFLEPKPLATPAGAYPLAALTYAAVAPVGLDPQARSEYAAFLDYAAGAGQTPGLKYGQLPPGYAPLPGPLRAQTSAAAVTVRTATAPTEEVRPLSVAERGKLAATAPHAASAPAAPLAAASLPAAPFTPTPPAALAASLPAAIPAPPGAAAALAILARTPADQLASTRWALPILVVVAILSGLGALEITKRPRKVKLASGQPDA